MYPAMKEHLPDGEAAVEHDIAEHKELERTMKELEAVEATDPRFDTLIGELETTLADHVNDEESDQFPKLRASIPRAELVQLGQKVQAAKKLAPTRPHPAAPNAELFHKLVGPASAWSTACATSSRGARRRSPADARQCGGPAGGRTAPASVMPGRAPCRGGARPTTLLNTAVAGGGIVARR